MLGNSRIYFIEIKSSNVLTEMNTDEWIDFDISSNGFLAGIKANGNVQYHDLNCVLGTKFKETSKIVKKPGSESETRNLSVKDSELKKILSKFGEFPEKYRVSI